MQRTLPGRSGSSNRCSRATKSSWRRTSSRTYPVVSCAPTSGNLYLTRGPCAFDIDRYNTPKGIRHMTLWARRELSLEEVESYMIDWIERERPGVRRWNLDENASRSIQVYHVHIYTQVRHCGEKIDLRDALISLDIFLAGVGFTGGA